jgi:hypothetical protein
MLCHRCGLILMQMDVIDTQSGKVISPDELRRRSRGKSATRARESFHLVSSSSETKQETSDTSASDATSNSGDPESA